MRGGVTDSLVRRAAQRAADEVLSVVPDGRTWHYVDFRVIELRPEQRYVAQTGQQETVLVLIGGTIDVRSNRGIWAGVGSRMTPFDGPPEAVYLPPQSTYELEALTPAEVAICAASATSSYDARRITVDRNEAKVRGTGHAERTVYNILMDPAAADALFITEVLTPPGNWSSYPPHKHDTDDPPNESALEEVYYHRISPHNGFAFQRIYTADGELDETITAFDRDAVLVPRGYHVCAAAPEYTLYYLNVLAGPKHVYHMTFDPAHEWIKAGWVW